MALASVVFFLMTVGAIVKNGPSGFFHAFVPSGVPLPILFLLVPLEIMGVVIKGGVLGLRLFANMLAGHIALFSILGLILNFGARASRRRTGPVRFLPGTAGGLSAGLHLHHAFLDVCRPRSIIRSIDLFLTQTLNPTNQRTHP
jgi:F0F1-type ATP synthase membrane subunit a